jgi:dTDP-4-dehydrorhamnose reductase
MTTNDKLKMKILVTGSKGQLGNEIRLLSGQFSENSYLFTDIEELDICDKDAVDDFLSANPVDLIINCAAYTAVDKAEQDAEAAFRLNDDAVDNLCSAAQKRSIFLLHTSTDYVFDGSKKGAYLESDPTNPVSVYGKSKLKGEEILIKYQMPSMIIRTSWLYSSFGGNFVKTILRLAADRPQLNVVCDQFGAPTYARDLAKAILQIVSSGKFPMKPEVYHFANEGRISWYDFAVAILELAGSKTTVNPIPAIEWPTPAARPANSLFSLDKIKKDFDITIPFWKDSLGECLEVLLK